MPPFRKQGDEPLYPKVLWNRPVARQAGGRVLIIGGHKTDFSLPTNLYQLTVAAGIGQATVVLPDSLQKPLAGLPDIEFVPSSPSGALGKAALGPILELLPPSDVVVLAGLGNNSETTVLAESIVRETTRPLILTGDSAFLISDQLSLVTTKPDNLLVVTLPELFKIANTLHIPTQISRTDLAGKLTIIEHIGSHLKSSLIVIGDPLVSFTDNQLIVTYFDPSAQTEAAICATASVFWAQNPSDHTAAAATAAYVLKIASKDRPQLSTSELAKRLRQTLDQF